MNNCDIHISVLMSIYHEPSTFVNKAIHSILNQTFSKFEFIIVLDKPDNEKMKTLLDTWAKRDKRIRILINRTNIGLAMSLNRGIEAAHGKYIARMDADDISKPARLERELSFMVEKEFDMVSCLVDKIDENGLVWDYTSLDSGLDNFAAKILPIQNIIVHPTVLMKTESVRKLQCYRPFSSCQDYDLWLRMLTQGMKIGVLNESLLFFRRHPGSITASKRFGQLLNEKYIRILYKERLRYEDDSFSEENLNEFLSKHGAKEKNLVEKENLCLSMWQQGIKDIKRRKMLKGIVSVLKSFKAQSVRESFLITIRARIAKKKFLSK